MSTGKPERQIDFVNRLIAERTRAYNRGRWRIVVLRGGRMERPPNAYDRILYLRLLGNEVSLLYRRTK